MNTLVLMCWLANAGLVSRDLRLCFQDPPQMVSLKSNLDLHEVLEA